MTEPRLSRDSMMMSMAQVVALRGTCSRLHVGAIISRAGRVISTGYNGTPAGMDHCIHTDDSPCKRAVHAEANGIAFAARYGVACEGAEIHVTHAPCINCAMLIINAGMERVVFMIPYRDTSGLDLLNDAGLLTMRLP